MPITITALHKGGSVTFQDRDIVKVNITEAVTPEYDLAYVYGRNVPIVSFKNTKRTIKISFVHKFVGVTTNYNELISFMYPVRDSSIQGASLYSKTPLFKIEALNILNDTGVISGFTATPSFDTLAKVGGNVYYTEVNYSFDFTPLDTSKSEKGTTLTVPPNPPRPTEDGSGGSTPSPPPLENYAKVTITEDLIKQINGPDAPTPPTAPLSATPSAPSTPTAPPTSDSATPGAGPIPASSGIAAVGSGTSTTGGTTSNSSKDAVVQQVNNNITELRKQKDNTAAQAEAVRLEKMLELETGTGARAIVIPPPSLPPQGSKC